MPKTVTRKPTEWPVTGVQLRACPRCDEGAIETNLEGDKTCLTCGFVRYFQKPKVEVVDPLRPEGREAAPSLHNRAAHKNKGKPGRPKKGTDI